MRNLLQKVRLRELILFLLGAAGMGQQFLIAEHVQVELVLASLAMMGVAIPDQVDRFIRSRTSTTTPPEPPPQPKPLSRYSTLEIQHALEAEQRRRATNGDSP